MVLTETQQRESKLIVDVEEWREQSDAETRIRFKKSSSKSASTRECCGTCPRRGRTPPQSATKSPSDGTVEEAETASMERFEQLQSV
jgi:hypothetical protein